MLENETAGPILIDSPGQDLLEIVQRMPEKGVTTILGHDLVALLEVMPGIADRLAAKRSVGVRLLQDSADDLLSRSSVRKLLFDCMSEAKQQELAARLGLSQSASLRSFDPTIDVHTWQRFLGFFGIDGRAAVPFTPEPTHSKIVARLDLFPHQKQVADRAFEVAQDSHGRALLHMPTGAGKTRTTMDVMCRYMIANHPSVVVWLAASSELLDQAADAFEQAWQYKGDRSLDLIRAWGDHNPAFTDLKDGVVIGGFAKMHSYMTRNRIECLRLAQKVQLVVVDEAHQAIAPTYKALIEHLIGAGPRHSLLGLTATPGRTWSDIGVDAELANFFGGKKITIEIEGWDNPVTYLIQEGYLAKPKFNRLTYAASDELEVSLRSIPSKGTDYSEEVLEQLSKDAARNNVIISEVERMLADGHRRIILFGASVRHAEMCSAIMGIRSIDARVVTCSP